MPRQNCIKVRWFMSLVLSMTTPLDQSILRNAKYPNRRCSSGGYNFNDLKTKVCKNKQRIGFIRRQGGDFGMGLKVRGCLFGFQCKRSRRRRIRRACHAAGNLSV
ncbi:MAG: hypothetical protein USCAAHI_00945 [Beijerinckiaceae bacterium]|nr:MAG: hypothetical protein USCAAHI_00945 [Beijerinckiaceae bacterium]